MTKPIDQKRRTIKNPIGKYNDYLADDQKLGKNIINDNIITIIDSKAGSGKTHLAMVTSLEAQSVGKKNGGISKIVITRPTVFRKEDNIGFIPGSSEEKYAPWVSPLIEIAQEIDGGEITQKKLNNGTISVIPMMFLQGRTFNDSFVIVDEVENCTREQIMGIFTRLGRNSKLVLCGDMAQCLLPSRAMSGMPRLLELVGQIKGLAKVNLTTNWRNEIIEELLNKY